MARLSTAFAVAAAIATACTGASPSPSVTTDSVPGAPMTDPSSTDPASPLSTIPAAPWTVRVFDGSGNVWRLSRDGSALPATVAYEPMTPERSSSGVYSGGEPSRGRLTVAQEGHLWQHVARVQGDTAHHITARRMGTVAVEVGLGAADPTTTLSDTSAVVDELLAFCASTVASTE